MAYHSIATLLDVYLQYLHAYQAVIIDWTVSCIFYVLASGSLKYLNPLLYFIRHDDRKCGCDA